MGEEILLVDDQDRVTGYGEKIRVHQKGLLHRAFSIFVYDRKEKEMLLQRRAAGKYHSGGLWTNACCSHPRRNETMEESMQKRLKAELGYQVDFQIADPRNDSGGTNGTNVIYNCGTFKYFAKYDTLSEHEIDHVFLLSPVGGVDHERILVNPEEVEEIRWISVPRLKNWMRSTPDEFTVWFEPAFDMAVEVLDMLNCSCK